MKKIEVEVIKKVDIVIPFVVEKPSRKLRLHDQLGTFEIDGKSGQICSNAISKEIFIKMPDGTDISFEWRDFMDAIIAKWQDLRELGKL